MEDTPVPEPPSKLASEPETTGGILSGLGGFGGMLGGASLAAGAAGVGMLGTTAKLAMRGVHTYLRRNYMTKLEIPCTDLSYTWKGLQNVTFDDTFSHFEKFHSSCVLSKSQ